jgi:hypothetical protein
VMVVLWIRNLSLHFTANGGSSFMACSMTGSPPHIIGGPVRDTWRVSTKHTTHLVPRRSDQVLLDPNLVLHSTASGRTKSISTVGCKGTENGNEPLEPWS